MIDFEGLKLGNKKSAEALKVLAKDTEFTGHMQNQARFMASAMSAIQRAGVTDGAQGLLLEQVLKHRKTLDGRDVMIRGDGRELVVDSGIAGVGDWLEHEGKKTHPFLFGRSKASAQSDNVPPANTSPTAGNHPSGNGTMTRSAFDALPAHKKMEAAKSQKIVDG